MTSITLNVTGARIQTAVNGPLTSGMVGIPVTIRYDDVWNGLTKNLVCRCGKWGPEKGETRTVLNIGETATVAHEVMQADMHLYLGIEGYSADGKLVIPTTWADCGWIQYGADTGADPSADPKLSIWAQLQAEIEQIKQNPVTEGEIAAAVAAYLEENPIEGSDFAQNVVVDTTLTVEGAAADAKAVGDAIAEEAQARLGMEDALMALQYSAVKSVNGIAPDADGNVKITIPDSGGNVDLTGYLKLPTDEDGKPNYGTAGHYAVSDGNGGITWVEAGNSGGSSGGDTPVVPGSHGIVWDLVNVTSSNPITSVSDGASLVAVLTPADGFTLGDVIVTMGSEVLTGVWNADTATVTIVAVTGDVIISCSGVEGQTSKTYTAEFYNKSNSTPYTITDNGDGTYPVSETAGVSETGNYYAIYKFSEEAANHNGGTLSFELLSDDYSYYEIRFLFVDANMCHKEGPVSGGGETYYYAFGTTSKPAEGELSVLEWVYAKGDGTEWHRKSVFGKSAIIPGVPAGTYPIVLVGGLFDSSGTSVGATTLSAEVLQELFSFKLTTDVAEKTSVAEIVDADYLQDYGIATTSLVTDVEDTTTFKGVLETAKNEWMLAYGGDMNKIPLIIHTDQHGCLARGNVCGDVFAAISNMVNWYDISKVVNLGDTANDYPNHEDLTAGSVALENYLDAMKEVPYSKRIEIFGNHDVSYFDGPMLTAIYHDQSYLQPYFRNIFARRVSNNGYFAIKDDNFNVKYVAISNMEYDETFAGKHIMSTKQIEWLISEFSKADGYDVVLLSHMPCTNSYFELTNIESIITARKSKTSGTMTDAYGVQHTFDFSNCDGELLCSLNGHMHEDANGFTGELAYAMFQNFYASPRCLYFVLIDRANRQLNIWKVDSTPQYQNFQVPLDKPAE